MRLAKQPVITRLGRVIQDDRRGSYRLAVTRSTFDSPPGLSAFAGNDEG
jgi:hypothetical protein